MSSANWKMVNFRSFCYFGIGVLGFSLLVFENLPQSFADVEIQISPRADSGICEIDESCYSPSALIIKIGEVVTWINDDNKAHSIVSGSAELGEYGYFKSGIIIPDKRFTHKFNEAGQFFYYCQTHPWMKGIVMAR